MIKAKSVSSKDVAKEAGVSQATVSYVLNNVQGIKIKPETREAVFEASRKLDYHPNLIARSMRLKKSMSIGIVSDKNISNFMFMQVLEGIKDTLVPKNYSITLCFNKSPEVENAEHIKYYSSNRIDGIIFVYATLDDNHIAYLIENGIPFVIIDNNVKSEIIHLVKTEMSEAIAQAILHFKTNGSERIAYFGTAIGKLHDRRYSGFIKALEKYKLTVQEELFLKLSDGDEDFDNIIGNYLEGCSLPPHAIFCESTNLAFKVLKYLASKAINVPTEIRVVALGTSKFCPFSFPALSAIEAPLYHMGFKGAGMLLDMINGSITEDIVILEWNFVPRESS